MGRILFELRRKRRKIGGGRVMMNGRNKAGQEKWNAPVE